MKFKVKVITPTGSEKIEENNRKEIEKIRSDMSIPTVTLINLERQND